MRCIQALLLHIQSTGAACGMDAAKKKAKHLAMLGFSEWLPDLGSNQGPAD